MFDRSLQLRKRASVLIMLLLPLASACSSSGGGQTASVDPPPSHLEEAMLRQAEGISETGTISDAPDSLQPSGSPASAEASAFPAAAETAGDFVTVYLEDQNGYLAPMTLRIGTDETAASESVHAAAETALSWLTSDPGRADQLPEGFAAVLPEGAKVESVELDTETGTASIDFAELPRVPAAKERKMLEAIVWSITELPGIDKVKLTVAGKPVRSMPVSKLPVDEVLTRGIGINVENSKDVPLSRAMGVTLYFSAYGENGDGYFVPVTRLIARTPDRVQAALNELIQGPSDTLHLQDVLLPGLSVDELTSTTDTVNVALVKEGWTADQAVPSDMMEALVLTMTEAAGVPRVKVAMNGVDSFLDSDRRSYDRPVTRPAAVNTVLPKAAR
jgi:germination protein M